MKKFTIQLCLFVFSCCLILLCSFSYRIYKTREIKWTLPKDTHILFMGASHIEKGINDSIFKGSINLARGSERYLFTYLKLKELLKANSQIDTVFLQFAPTDVWKNTDSKYYSENEMSFFLPSYFPLFTKDEWSVYYNIGKKEAISLLFQKVIKDIPDNKKDLGRFLPERRKKFDPAKKAGETRDWLEQGHEINFAYLRKIIDLCQKNSVQLYFIYMPVYDPQKFYDQNEYYEVYKKHFSDIQLLDYSRWKCPDEWRSDAHHLNITGANSFTTELYTRFKTQENKEAQLQHYAVGR